MCRLPMAVGWLPPPTAVPYSSNPTMTLAVAYTAATVIAMMAQSMRPASYATMIPLRITMGSSPVPHLPYAPPS